MTKSETFGIVSDRPWNAALASRLSRRLGGSFLAISKPDELTPEKLDRLGVGILFFPHWSSRIPDEVWTKFECIVFHMTDLPFGRGGSPLQNLILRGHESTVLSAIRCTAELDGGPIYRKRPLSLAGTAEEILIRADGVIEEMIVEILLERPVPTAQEGEVTRFRRRRPEESDLMDVSTLQGWFDRIRMLDAEGYPHAFVRIGSFRLEFRRVSRRVGGLTADVVIRQEPDQENNGA